MKTHRRKLVVTSLLSILLCLSGAASLLRADSGTCGGASVSLPFTDVAGNGFFCWIAEAYFSGLTGGTSTSTYSPASPVPREQMAVFITRAMDQALKRGSTRAAMKRWWTPQSYGATGWTPMGNQPQMAEFDGADLWVTNYLGDSVFRVHASDGKVLGVWTVNAPYGLVAARGHIYVTTATLPGALYSIDPTQMPGPATLVTQLDAGSRGIAFDGSKLWTANALSVCSVSFDNGLVVTSFPGFDHPSGILFDGANVWVAESTSNRLFRLRPDGSVQQTVVVGTAPQHPVFDGTNIWVPCGDNSVVVVRASNGQVLATLTNNGLNNPQTAAFDGERILVTNYGGNSVSLWRATDLAPLGSVSLQGPGVPTQPFGAASDGISFWVTLSGADKLVRF